MALDMGLKKQSGAASPPTISTESFLPTELGREPSAAADGIAAAGARRNCFRRGTLHQAD